PAPRAPARSRPRPAACAPARPSPLRASPSGSRSRATPPPRTAVPFRVAPRAGSCARRYRSAAGHPPARRRGARPGFRAVPRSRKYRRVAPRPRQQVAVERLQLGDTGFERPQMLGARFMLLNLRVDVPQDVVELRRLTDGAIHYFALLLQHRDLLRHIVGERLERAQLSFGVGRVRRSLPEMGK